MKYNDLTIVSTKKKSRVGRGIAAGQGKTAGRGTKGQNSRKSGGTRPGFEGGQMPLYMRIPKLPGFHSLRKKAENVYTGQLDALAPTIDNTTLVNAGLVSSEHVVVKLVSKGVIKKKLQVSLQAASKSSILAIEEAGGSFNVIPQVKRVAKIK